MNFWDFFAERNLAHRKEGFRTIFERLDALPHAPLIIETGCVRRDDSWDSDGSSSRLFDMYAQLRPGTRFVTVDIDRASTDCAKRHCKAAEIYTADSVTILGILASEGNQADLLYLDSFDCDLNNPLPSANHHLREIGAALPMISPETMVVVDDCFYNGTVHGKGTLVAAFAAGRGADPFLLDYQCGWTGMHNR